MSAPIDCPICMDSIENTKNCVTTECGHCFHTNCLMKSVAHNGFGCPYCRTAMAEEPEDEDSSYSGEDDEEDEELYNDDSLRGFRFFWNIINGEEIDEEDDADEQQLEEWEDVDSDEDEEESRPNSNVPSIEFIGDKLRSQGISYDDLVTIILCRDHYEYEDNNIFIDNKVYGKIRSIISRYDPPQNVAPEEVLETN